MKSELRRRLREILIMLVLLVAAYFGLDLQAPTAPVTGVYTAVDGDSLRKGGQDVRLHGIDAPELHQTCSRRNGQDSEVWQLNSGAHALPTGHTPLIETPFPQLPDLVCYP